MPAENSHDAELLRIILDEVHRREQIEFERQKWQAEQSLARQRKLWDGAPLNATVTVAVLGALLTAWTAYGQINASRELERQKFETQLIIKALEVGDSIERSRSLAFLVQTGLISDPGGRINRATESSDALPSFAPGPLVEAPPGFNAVGSDADRVTAVIGPEKYETFKVSIPDQRGCRLRGRVATVGGGSRDVDVLVLAPDDLAAFRDGRRYASLFSARRTTQISLDVALPGPGQYSLVISNRFSAFSGKQVLVEGLRWECIAASSDL